MAPSDGPCSHLKFLEEVAVLQILMNGTRMDVRGRFLDIGWRGQTKGLAKVQVNGVELFVPQEKVVRWSEYKPEGSK